MSLPTMTGVGRATADPELRFAPSGTPVAKVNLAFNSRKKDQQGNWVDDQVFFVNGTAFNRMAENLVETVVKGTEVIVTGRLQTRQWEDKEGNKRSTTELVIDSIGPNLSFATAKVTKASRENGGQRAAADDPWASATPASAGSRSGFDDSTPPF
jgi:single-strand DNA-binding protein